MKFKKESFIKLVALAGLSLFLITGCRSTLQTRNVETSGFLGDYSHLEKGTDDQAQMIYIDPRVDFVPYTRILMDPIKFYTDSSSKLEGEDKQRVVNYLHAAIVEQLKKEYVFVSEPSEKVMRLRVAITEATSPNVVLDTVSSIMPPGIALGLVKQVATGTNISVGKASIEMELQDSMTGKRLAAAVDERAGQKYTGKFDKYKKYHAVEDAFDYWAEKLRNRLIEVRGSQPIINE